MSYSEIPVKRKLVNKWLKSNIQRVSTNGSASRMGIAFRDQPGLSMI